MTQRRTSYSPKVKLLSARGVCHHGKAASSRRNNSKGDLRPSRTGSGILFHVCRSNSSVGMGGRMVGEITAGWQHGYENTKKGVVFKRGG